MAHPRAPTKPKLGMTLAFTPTACPPLAGIPATVIDIWPRFRSGEYLVTLEYARPVRDGTQVIRQIEAFVSELYEPSASAPSRGVPASSQPRPWQAGGHRSAQAFAIAALLGSIHGVFQ